MSRSARQAADARFAEAAERAADELHALLVADAMARVAGAALKGGIRRVWREHVEHLAELRTATPTRQPKLRVVR